MDLVVLVPICSIIALLFAVYFSRKVLKMSEGTEKSKKLHQVYG